MMSVDETLLCSFQVWIVLSPLSRALRLSGSRVLQILKSEQKKPKQPNGNGTITVPPSPDESGLGVRREVVL